MELFGKTFELVDGYGDLPAGTRWKTKRYKFNPLTGEVVAIEVVVLDKGYWTEWTGPDKQGRMPVSRVVDE